MSATIPVICDRCRATGNAGAGDFSHLGDLLDFEPVPVQPRVNGWDPDAQRAFIALLAATGSKRRAAIAIGRNAYGIDQLLKRADSASFRLAFDRAMAIARGDGAMKLAQGVADAAARNARLTPPSALRDPGLAEGQVRNETGEPEDEASFLDRAAAARDSISHKLLLARRLFLRDIANNRARRAAFEILTKFPIDWAKAKQLEPQADEPWRAPNLRKPDMLVTAEHGWMGDIVHGPDRKAELAKAMNSWLRRHGKPLLDLGEDFDADDDDADDWPAAPGPGEAGDGQDEEEEEE